MAYNLFKSNNTLTPYVIVSDNTIETSSTSLNLVGKKKENYGAAVDQNFVWLLENFSNATPPTDAILGQCWMNTVDNQLYICDDQGTQHFKKVSNPLVSGTAPTLSLQIGNLWFDSTNNRLYAWDGSAWDLIGPASSVPLSVQQTVYFNRITGNAIASEMWLNGVTNNRLVLPNNTTWLFSLTIIARRTDATGERRSIKFEGMIDNTTNTVVLDGAAQTNLSQAGVQNYSVTVGADNTNKSLLITVTGENSKTIEWNAVCTLSIAG